MDEKSFIWNDKALIPQLPRPSFALITGNEIILVVTILQTRLLTIVYKETSESGL